MKRNARSLRAGGPIWVNATRHASLAWAGLIGLAVLVAFLVSLPARGGDWPQILGPQRNGAAEKEPLADSWPTAGPKVLWRHKVGEGYAGPVVVGERVVVFHRRGDALRVESLDRDTGRQLWKADLRAAYSGGVNSDTGPRSTPVIHGGRVYLHAAAGQLFCLNLADGKQIWARKTHADYDVPPSYFGAGSTPLVLDGKLLVNVGGRNGAGIVAFDLESGRTLWKATSEQPSYSSPATIGVGDNLAAVFVTRLNVVVIDSAGKVLGRAEFGRLGPTVNAATPQVIGERIFVTASYGIGAKLLKSSNGKLSTVWAKADALSSQYNTPVVAGDYLYGINGREDVGVAELRCVRLSDGAVAWSERGFGTANLILADGKLLIVKNNGSVVLARANPKRFEKLAQAKIAAGDVRGLPALAGGKLVFRDQEGAGGTLYCVQVGP